MSDYITTQIEKIEREAKEIDRITKAQKERIDRLEQEIKAAYTILDCKTKDIIRLEIKINNIDIACKTLYVCVLLYCLLSLIVALV